MIHKRKEKGIILCHLLFHILPISPFYNSNALGTSVILNSDFKLICHQMDFHSLSFNKGVKVPKKVLKSIEVPIFVYPTKKVSLSPSINSRFISMVTIFFITIFQWLPWRYLRNSFSSDSGSRFRFQNF